MLVNPEASNQLEALHQPQVIRESAFSKQLHSAADANDKCSFNLLLSMVCDDALELDQFHLPNSPDPKDISEVYKQFFVRPQVLSGSVPVENDLRHNELIHQGYKDSIKLELALNPEPLIAEKPEIPEEVFDNLDINVRAKYLSSKSIEINVAESSVPPSCNSNKEIDVESWFNVLQQARALSAMA